MAIHRAGVVQVAIINDYPLVVAGLTGLLAAYPDRVAMSGATTSLEDLGGAHVVLFDTFGSADAGSRLGQVLAATTAKVLVFGWAAAPDSTAGGVGRGSVGYLSKRATAVELVTALEAVAAGRDVLVAAPNAHDSVGSWPGQEIGLTSREAEIIGLVTAGLSNAEIARRLFLSVNTVKSYIRTAYRKASITSRSQAVLWGIDHGFQHPR